MASICKLSKSNDATSTLSAGYPIYLYGIIPSDKPFTPETPAIDDVGDVFTIANNALTAVVCRTARSNYQSMERQEAAHYLLAHQCVVEEMMGQFPTLPMKFGMVLPDETTVNQLLEQGKSLCQATLDMLAGRVQVEIVVLWNIQEVFAQIAQQDEIVQMKAVIEGRPPEETVNERVALGQLVHVLLEKRRTALQDTIRQRLTLLSDDFVINGLMDDSMVLNVGMLMDASRQEELDNLLEELDQRFEGKLTFRNIGPLPPYSFATLEVKMPRFDEITEARQCLGLEGQCEGTDIKKAYRRLAAEHHPDHNPDDPAADIRMTALTQAYRLLSRYAESQVLNSSGESGNGTVVNFGPEAVADTLLIGILHSTAQG